MRRNRDVFVRNQLTAELNKGGGAAASAAIVAQKLLGVTKSKFPVQDLPPHTPRDVQKDLDYLKERLSQKKSPAVGTRVSRVAQNASAASYRGPATVSRSRLGRNELSESDIRLPRIKPVGTSVSGS